MFGFIFLVASLKKWNNSFGGLNFRVMFYGFCHGIYHHVSPPFGRICLMQIQERGGEYIQGF